MFDLTVEDWCKSFLTCFQSPVPKRRCLKDFDFYKRLFVWPPRQQAFTFEIGTYLSATRIQANYCPYRYYSFSVNITHCDSGGRYNGSGMYLIFGYDFLNKNLVLFRVVGSCRAKFETVKLLSQRLPTFCSEESCNNVGSVSTTLHTLLGLLTRITHVYKVLWVVFFPRCTAGLICLVWCKAVSHSAVLLKMQKSVAQLNDCLVTSSEKWKQQE